MHGGGTERAPENARGLIFDREAQLADLASALWPLRLGGGELGKIALIVEAWDGVVGLRLQIGAQDAPLCERLKKGQRVAGNYIVYERSDKNGLAGARKPRHAEPHR